MGHTTLLRMAALTMATVVVLAGCGREMRPAPSAQSSTPAGPTTAATDFAGKLAKGMTRDAMMAHLTKLQEIADANGGNRALGTPGYDASVDYVANTLRDKGFDVQTAEFDVRLPFADEPRVTVGGATSPQNRWSTPSAPRRTGWRPRWCLLAAEDSPGCTAVRLRRPTRYGRGRAGGPRQVPVLATSRRRPPNAARWR